MVVIGSPELPGDSENNLSTNGTHIINYDQNTNEDSDGENENIYDGYEPLQMNETMEQDYEDNSVSNESIEENLTQNDSNLPNIISSDTEIAQQVWNAPRVLRTEEIELDTSKAEQIMSAMAAVTLPKSAIPDWAQVVPEEKWKQDLLDKIRQRKDIPSSDHN